jgi:hypothetical protein
MHDADRGRAAAHAFAEGLRKTVAWYLGHRACCARITEGVYQRERLGLIRPAAHAAHAAHAAGAARRRQPHRHAHRARGGVLPRLAAPGRLRHAQGGVEPSSFGAAVLDGEGTWSGSSRSPTIRPATWCSWASTCSARRSRSQRSLYSSLERRSFHFPDHAADLHEGDRHAPAAHDPLRAARQLKWISVSTTVPRWTPSATITDEEQEMLDRLGKRRRQFAFLRLHRAELFDECYRAASLRSTLM